MNAPAPTLLPLVDKHSEAQWHDCAQGAITIEVRSHYASLPASVFELVQAGLQTHQHRWELGGARGHEHQIESVQHFILRGDKLIIPAGLVEYVRDLLKDQGYRVAVDDRTVWAALQRAERSLVNCSAPSQPDRELLTGLGSAPRGQILYQDHRELARWIGLLCEFFPRERIFIVVTNKSDAGVWRSKLKRHVSGRDLFVDPIAAKGVPGGVLISTPHWFGLANPDDWDVLVFLDPKAACAKQAISKFTEMEDQLRYCAAPRNCTAGPRMQFQIEELFGRPLNPTVAEQPAAVQVLALPYGQLGVGNNRSILETKRHHVWNDWDRCRFVGYVAVEFGSHTLNSSLLDSFGAPIWHGGQGASPAVAIMTETLEHARNLQRLLPGWELSADTYADDDGLPVSYGVPVGGNTIVTASYAQLFGVRVDVLIWAGGAHWPLEDDAFPRAAAGQKDSVLLVDIADQHDTQLRKLSERRLVHYRNKGWKVIHTPPTRTLVIRKNH
jgi:hypothetical protein